MICIWRAKLKKLLIVVLAVLLIFFGGCTQVPEQDEYTVVASFYPLYISALNLTEGVDGVRVVNMAGQQAGCLHDYQLQNRDMRTLEDADLFLVNGAGMENFLEKVTEHLPELSVADASEGFELIDDNPHIWVSPRGNAYQVRKIAAALKAGDPAHLEQYERNEAAYLEKLDALLREMHEKLDPLRGRDIVTMHEAFPYLAKEFSLNTVGVINREPDSSPSAREIAETIDLVRELHVTALFAEPQYSTSAADIIAGETDAKVYTLDPVVTGEDSPDAYLQAMRNNTDTLLEALG